MTNEQTAKDRKIKRPVVSDLDGTQQGGLAFCVSLIGGAVLAAALAPGSLTSFWVWFTLLTSSSAIALGTQKLFATVTEETDE
mgnify:CR=1 FL=1